MRISIERSEEQFHDSNELILQLISIDWTSVFALPSETRKHFSYLNLRKNMCPFLHLIIRCMTMNASITHSMRWQKQPFFMNVGEDLSRRIVCVRRIGVVRKSQHRFGKLFSRIFYSGEIVSGTNFRKKTSNSTSTARLSFVEWIRRIVLLHHVRCCWSMVCMCMCS